MNALRSAVRPAARQAFARAPARLATKPRFASTAVGEKPKGLHVGGLPVPVEAYPLIFIVSFMCGCGIIAAGRHIMVDQELRLHPGTHELFPLVVAPADAVVLAPADAVAPAVAAPPA